MAGNEKPSALASFPLVTEIPVHWGDQDAFGHVNNTVPLRWFESARVSYLEQSGLGHLMNGGELAPMVVSVTCHYRRQVRFPEVMQVGIRVATLRRSSFVMEQLAYSKGRGEVAVEGSVVIVLFDYLAQRPRRIPLDVKAALERFEGREIAFEPSRS